MKLAILDHDLFTMVVLNGNMVAVEDDSSGGRVSARDLAASLSKILDAPTEAVRVPKELTDAEEWNYDDVLAWYAKQYRMYAVVELGEANFASVHVFYSREAANYFAVELVAEIDDDATDVPVVANENLNYSGTGWSVQVVEILNRTL